MNGLVLLEHIGQHMMAGLGLRQVIDWMMFVNTALHDEEWSTFQEMAQAAGLETLAKVATKMCVRYFGLTGSFEWCMDADDAVVDEILDYLFASGNFGSKKRDEGKVSIVENRFCEIKKIYSLLYREPARSTGSCISAIAGSGLSPGFTRSFGTPGRF